MSKNSSSSLTETKPQYHILNGLRGVAAIMVIWYHIFEAFATSPIDQKFNHGYLAVIGNCKSFATNSFQADK